MADRVIEVLVWGIAGIVIFLFYGWLFLMGLALVIGTISFILRLPKLLCAQLLKLIDRINFTLPWGYKIITTPFLFKGYRRIKIIGSKHNDRFTWIDFISEANALLEPSENEPKAISDQLFNKAVWLTKKLEDRDHESGKTLAEVVLYLFSVAYMREREGSQDQKRVWNQGVHFNTTRLQTKTQAIIPKEFLPSHCYKSYRSTAGSNIRISFEGSYPHQDILNKIEAARIEAEKEAQRKRIEAEKQALRKKRYQELLVLLNKDQDVTDSLQVFQLHPKDLNRRSLEFRETILRSMHDAGRSMDLPAVSHVSRSSDCLLSIMSNYSEFYPELA